MPHIAYEGGIMLHSVDVVGSCKAAFRADRVIGCKIVQEGSVAVVAPARQILEEGWLSTKRTIRIAIGADGASICLQRSSHLAVLLRDLMFQSF